MVLKLWITIVPSFVTIKPDGIVHSPLITTESPWDIVVPGYDGLHLALSDQFPVPVKV
jgi:hypothetical protein